MFREAMANGTPLGEEIRPIYESGGLVPDDLTIALIRERLGEDDAAGGFVLDGFPRNMAQAEALDELLREIGRQIDVVFEFQIADRAELERRMVERARIENRSDDTPDAMQRRLTTYYEQTAPLVEHYRTARGNVVGIHADRSIDEVWAEVQEALVTVESRKVATE
jgi:adenylate kinase